MSERKVEGRRTASWGLLWLLLFLVVVATASYGIYGILRPFPEPEPAPPVTEPGATKPPSLTGAGRRAEDAPPVAGTQADTASPRDVLPPTDDEDGASVAETPPIRVDKPPEERSAVRRSPYGPPKRKPGTRFGPSGGGAGSGGPTGHWTRFGSFPEPKGTARLTVTVEDEGGNPIPGADVYLGPPDVAGTDGISFGDLRKLGATNDKGVFQADALPDGAAAVLGNYNNRLNGRRGLDGRHGKRTVLRAGASVALAVRLPLALGAVGKVMGRVLDPGGNAIASASVSTGFNRKWSDKQGGFVLDGVPAGESRLKVSATGFAPASVPLKVVAGKTMTRDVELSYADSGSMRLEGRVTGPEGEPVADANVYLMLTEERGTLRRARTDGAGRFVMEELPERVRKQPARLQASRFPHYASRMTAFEEGIQDERVDLALPVRYVQLLVRVLDGETGEPIRLLNARADRPESKRPQATLTLDRKTGVRRGMVERGRHVIHIDALDHEDLEFDLDVQPDAEWRCEHEVRLKRLRPESVEVALTVRITEAGSDTPVKRARIEVLEAGADSQAVSLFEGVRDDGAYRMPAPSGTRRLVVTAAGYEAYGAALELAPGEPEAEVVVRLQPR